MLHISILLEKTAYLWSFNRLSKAAVIWHAFFTSMKEIQAKKNNNTTCAAYPQTFSSETIGGKNCRGIG